MDYISYFGYGANADPNRIKEIIGHIPEKKNGGIISNFRLCVQTLNQIPEPAKNILESVWGKKFLAYTISPGNGLVVGALWQLSASDFSKLKEWEELDGWRKFIPIKVTLYDNTIKQAVTDQISSLNQSLFGCVDSILYQYDLNECQPRTTDQIIEEEERNAKIEAVRKEIKKMFQEKNYSL
jgi:hypothetical protein